MPVIADSLKTRYEAVFQSHTDSHFYVNLHRYLDFAEKNAVLKTLLDTSENDYRKKHIAIWDRDHKLTDEEADDRAERSIRMERFNLYASGAFLYGQVYLPIEDYKSSIDETEFEQDPAAVVMIKGANNINPEYAKRSPAKWGKDNIKRLNRRYKEHRVYYEERLKNFHLNLLDALEKTDVPVSNEITFDQARSVLNIGAKTVRIAMKNDKPNAHYVLKYIFDHGKAEVADYTDIIKEHFPRERMEWRAIYRACQDLEKKIREQAGITDFLTTTTGKTGYIRINPPYA